MRALRHRCSSVGTVVLTNAASADALPVQNVAVYD